jgi:hypothetical protein
MQVLVAFSAKAGRENIFKPTIDNWSLHSLLMIMESHPKNLIVKNTHPNIHKFT